MIVGYISAQFEPIIPVSIRNDIGGSVDIEAVLDTGFNGWLMVTPPIIAQLQLTSFNTAETILADGRVVSTDLYIVRVIWQGTERIIIAESGIGTPLLGMLMLQDARVTMDVRYNGEVSILPIP